MTNTQMNYFLSVAREGSFSEAARQLYVSQPAISKQISRMEEELGLLLFDRTGKQISLTEEGRILEAFFLRCQQDYSATLEQIHQRTNQYQGTVRIGCLDTWDASRFFRALTDQFQKSHPAISITIGGYSASELLIALFQREIDVGFTVQATILRNAGLARPMLTRPFTSIGAGLLYSAEFAPQGQAVCLRDFQDQTFLISSGIHGDAMEYSINRICYADGFAPKVKRCKRLASSVTEVLCGKGVMMTDEWSFLRGNQGLGYLPLAHLVPTCIIYLPEETTGAKNLFINEAMYLFGKEQTEE